MVNLVIRTRFRRFIKESIIENLIKNVFSYLNISSPMDVSIIITNDKEIRDLNLTYRNEDKPTDVLSFNNEYTDPETGHQYLGDIVIAYPIAKKQAEAIGNNIQDELNLLTVHGMLHLLGYDHADETGQAEMWLIQKEVLAKS